MTDRELMQQALEALNRSDYLGWQLNIPIIKALRERLAQPDQWQGLTDEEIKDCQKQAMVNGSLPFEQRSFFARTIEAKLKEKNT